MGDPGEPSHPLERYSADAPWPEPRRRSWRHFLAATVLWVTGWRPWGELPADRRYVMIMAPHTSNWDGFWAVVFGWWYDEPLAWLVKDEFMVWPLRPVLSALGAIPVDRRAHTAMVERLAERIRAREAVVLGLPPEGTRRKVEAWRTGFHHIARAAGVPVALGFIDYRRKAAGYGPLLHPGELDRDAELLAAFYAGVHPRHPELASPVRFRADP